MWKPIFNEWITSYIHCLPPCNNILTSQAAWNNPYLLSPLLKVQSTSGTAHQRSCDPGASGTTASTEAQWGQVILSHSRGCWEDSTVGFVQQRDSISFWPLVGGHHSLSEVIHSSWAKWGSPTESLHPKVTKGETQTPGWWTLQHYVMQSRAHTHLVTSPKCIPTIHNPSALWEESHSCEPLSHSPKGTLQGQTQSYKPTLPLHIWCCFHSHIQSVFRKYVIAICCLEGTAQM